MNHHNRLTRLMADLDGTLLVSSLANIRYLTGFAGSSAYLVVTSDGATFVTDGRYGEVASGLVDRLPATTLSIYRAGLYDRLCEVFGAAEAVQLEAAHITWEAKRALAEKFGGSLEAGTGVVEGYRLHKDEDEIAALRKAASAGDSAFAALGEIEEGAATEGDLGEGLIHVMESHGGERAGWAPIVAVGANAARPHHRSGDGRLGGGLLLLDYGCVVDGYHSDMTRTVWRDTEPDGEAAEVYAAVLEANEVGIAAVRPGALAGDVDAAARGVLAGHGLDAHFLHSTGHGVGLEIHEAPAVRRGSEETLEPGNVVTVEPGVYLSGRLGVRIEDMVVVTEDGGEVLTNANKDVVQA